MAKKKAPEIRDRWYHICPATGSKEGYSLPYAYQQTRSIGFYTYQ